MDPDVFQRVGLDQYGQKSGRGKVAGGLQRVKSPLTLTGAREIWKQDQGAAGPRLEFPTPLLGASSGLNWWKSVEKSVLSSMIPLLVHS